MVTGTQIKKALTPGKPSLERHDELIACAARRVVRACEKLERAKAEVTEAEAALHSAAANRNAWIEANPDPQISMF